MPPREGYRVRHLQTEAEREQFDRTAPIMAPDYWDLADEISRRDSDPSQIRVLRLGLVERVGLRAKPEDAAVIADSRKIMDETIRTEVRDFK